MRRRVGVVLLVSGVLGSGCGSSKGDISPATGGCEPIPAGVAATLNRLDTGPEIPPNEFAALATPTLP